MTNQTGERQAPSYHRTHRTIGPVWIRFYNKQYSTFTSLFFCPLPPTRVMKRMLRHHDMPKALLMLHLRRRHNKDLRLIKGQTTYSGARTSVNSWGEDGTHDGVPHDGVPHVYRVTFGDTHPFLEWCANSRVLKASTTSTFHMASRCASSLPPMSCNRSTRKAYFAAVNFAERPR